MDRITAGRVILLGLTALAMAAGIRYRHAVARALRSYFHETSHPVQLGAWRVVLFGSIFVMAVKGNSNPAWYNLVPEALWVPLPGHGWLDGPIPQWIAQCSQWGLIAFSLTACLGLFTRVSAWLSVSCGLIALGLPHFFTKINHYHHLVWFAAILATSRCGDALSLDAIRSGWRRADRGDLSVPGPARAYGLPLRFTWLLLGLLYFFPGVWKLWSTGLNWPLGDTLRYQMYEIWTKYDDYVPLLRVDKSPLLMKAAGISTIVFEIGLVFCFIPRRTRVWAALCAFLFHQFCGLFLHIPYFSLVICYPSFIAWQKVGTWLGRRVFKEQLRVVYDGGCRFCRRTIALLLVFDVGDRIVYVNGLDADARHAAGLDGFDETELLTDMHAVAGDRTHRGFDAYRALVARIPLLWPLYPLLFLPPVPALGRRLYRRAADRRACSTHATVPAAPPHRFALAGGLRAVTVMGLILVAGNILCGVLSLDTWPFTRYPHWDYWGEPVKPGIDIEAYDTHGQSLEIDMKGMARRFNLTRWDPMLMRISLCEDPKKQGEMCLGVWELLRRNQPSLEAAVQVRFFETTLWVDPDRIPENPVRRELVHKFAVRATE